LSKQLLKFAAAASRFEPGGEHGRAPLRFGVKEELLFLQKKKQKNS
jgi:hypothetical protein